MLTLTSRSRRGTGARGTRVGAGGGRSWPSGAVLGGGMHCSAPVTGCWPGGLFHLKQRNVCGTNKFRSFLFVYLGSLDFFRALATVRIKGDREISAASSASPWAQDRRAQTKHRAPGSPGKGPWAPSPAAGQPEPRARSCALCGDAPSPVRVLRSCAFTGCSPVTVSAKSM